MNPAVVATLTLLSIATIQGTACTVLLWRIWKEQKGFAAAVGQAGRVAVEAKDKIEARVRERV